MPTSGSNQSEHEKDNRGIVLEGHVTHYHRIRHQFVHVTSLDQSACRISTWGKEHTRTNLTVKKIIFLMKISSGAWLQAGHV